MPDSHSEFDLREFVTVPIDRVPAALAALAAAQAQLCSRLMLEVSDRPRPSPEPDLLTATALAHRLNLNESWIRGEQRRNRIPHIKVGRYVRFRAADVIAAIEARPDAKKPIPGWSSARMSSSRAAPSKLDYALGYAKHGRRVFPCHSVRDGACSCGKADCDNVGKHPLFTGWQNDATTDKSVIQKWWRQKPDANIGVACGAESNLTVLDVDGDAGRDRLHELEREHGALPECPIVITGSGGEHRYFQHEPGLNNKVRFDRGLDVRTTGGLVIGAGSANAHGEYLFEASATLKDVRPPKMPPWLSDCIRKGQGGKGTNGNGAGGKANDGAEIPEGRRDDTIFKLACKLRWAELSFDEVLAKVHKANAERCKPPLTDRHVQSKVEAAFKYQNEGAGEDETPDEEPRPLTQEIPDAEEFPIDALGPVLGPAAAAICGLAQAPAAIGGQSVLGTAALVVQAHADIELPHGQRRPTSLSLAIIADSGDRKTTCDRYAMEPVADFEKQLLAEYKDEFKAHLIERAIWEKERAQILKSGDDKRTRLAELGDEPEPPLKPMMTCSEPTYEGLVKLLSEGRGTSGVFSSEGGQFIGGFAMSTDNRLKTCAGLSNLWDGVPISRVRGADGSSLLLGRRVSMYLQMQPMVASGLFGDPLLDDQGILSRFLANRPTSLAGTRMWREPTAEQIENLGKYKRRVRQILDVQLPLADGERNTLNPRVLKLSSGAKRLWISFHDKIESQLAPGGPLEGTRPLANKIAEHAARLAAVVTLFADLQASEVDEEAMANGIELAQFYLKEGLRISH